MRRLLKRARRPAYTGENRCVPCTALNLTLAAAGSVALAAISPVLGAATFVASAVVVYLRGYLVPGTPTITTRYFPARLLALFGKGDAADRPSSAADTAEDVLRDCGALERAPAGDRRLAPDFRRAWNDAVRPPDEADSGPSAVADLLGVDPAAVSTLGDRYLVGDDRLVQWPSDAALAADLAAGRRLRARSSAWRDLDPDARLDALLELRALRRECPACGASVSRAEETVTSCCQPDATVVAVSCPACGSRLAETRIDRPPRGRR